MNVNQICISVNGIGFNCEVVARQTEEQFVAKEMGRKLQLTPIPERELILRDIYKMCVDKVTAPVPEPPEENRGNEGNGENQNTTEDENLKEPLKEDKKARGVTKPK